MRMTSEQERTEEQTFREDEEAEGLEGSEEGPLCFLRWNREEGEEAEQEVPGVWNFQARPHHG